MSTGQNCVSATQMQATFNTYLSVLCHVCVLCSRLLCPYFVCFLSLLSVIIGNFVQLCLSIIYIILCIYNPVCSVWFGLVYSLLPCVPVCVHLALSCAALFGVITDCLFELYHRLHVHRDRNVQNLKQN